MQKLHIYNGQTILCTLSTSVPYSRAVLNQIEGQLRPYARYHTPPAPGYQFLPIDPFFLAYHANMAVCLLPSFMTGKLVGDFFIGFLDDPLNKFSTAQYPFITQYPLLASANVKLRDVVDYIE